MDVHIEQEIELGDDCCVDLQLRVYLEGSLLNNGGATGPKGPLMRDDLRYSPYADVLGTNYIPATEPYTSLSEFTHVGTGGGEVATAGAFDDRGDNSVVDWVFVELRDKTDNEIVLETRSAFVQRDGDVVDVDGLSPLLFCDLPDDTYYVAVRHRNHLGVMSSGPELLTPSGTEVDFTNGNIGLSGEFNYGTSHPDGVGYDYTGLSQKDVSGVRALWLGNGNMDRKVKYNGSANDPNVTLNEVLFYPLNSGNFYNYDFGFGYFLGDFNMDSKAKYNGSGNDPNYVLNSVLFYSLNGDDFYNFDFMLEQIPR